MTSGGSKKVVSEEIEEEVIAINFKGQFADPEFVESVKSCKFHKLDEEEPLIQVGNQFFKAKPEVIHGTNVYFDIIKSNEGNTSSADGRKSSSRTEKSSSRSSSQETPATVLKEAACLNYLTKTSKSYQVRRVFLEKILPTE